MDVSIVVNKEDNATDQDMWSSSCWQESLSSGSACRDGLKLIALEDAMHNIESVPPAVRSRSHHWALFVAGIVLFVLGPVSFVAQYRLKNLGSVWYVPVLSSAGMLLLILSVRRRRSVVRMVFLMLFAIVCGFEWYAFTVATRSPAYTGPAQPGRKVPQFAARLADGAPSKSSDLETGTSTVMVFYRGRW
jgi:hypothetical protein